MNNIHLYNNPQLGYYGSEIATIDDRTLSSGSLTFTSALISESLGVDSFTFYAFDPTIEHPKLLLADKNGKLIQDSNGKYITVLPDGYNPSMAVDYGDYVTLDYDGNKIGRFFVEEVERVGMSLYKFTCIGIGGLLSNTMHKGGIYSLASAKSIIDDIILSCPGVIGEIDYSLVTDITLSGWLPYASCLDNLQQVLFATGWVARNKPKDFKTQLITLPYGERTISKQNININGGSLSKVKAASAVELTEHSFFQSNTDVTDTLFDNSGETAAASSRLIIFSEPHYNVTASGLTLEESGVNYAIVSGNGYVTGKRYSHSMTVMSASTGNPSADNTISVNKATLVTIANSTKVLDRLTNLYSVTQQAGIEFYPTPQSSSYVKPSNKVTFTDIFGASRTGFVTDLSMTLSKNLKARGTVALDFVPGPYGLDIDKSKLFTSSGTWTVPTGVTSITLIIGAGGQGGRRGYNGSSGGAGTGATHRDGIVSNGAGGAGGTAGTGGSGGKVYRETITVTPGEILTITIGAGGAGAAVADADGTLGGDSTVTVNGETYTSANGTPPTSGFLDPITGVVYASPGDPGIDGLSGKSQEVDSRNIEWNGVEYVQGGNGNSNDKEFTLRYSDIRAHGIANGGLGGGAAAGGNGASGANGSTGGDADGGGYSRGGAGGTGGDAGPGINATIPGAGGGGGNGGGGGGGGGAAKVYTVNGEYAYLTATGGNGGPGGNGGSGGAGANGFVDILYKG